MDPLDEREKRDVLEPLLDRLGPLEPLGPNCPRELLDRLLLPPAPAGLSRAVFSISFAAVTKPVIFERKEKKEVQT